MGTRDALLFLQHPPMPPESIAVPISLVLMSPMVSYKAAAVKSKALSSTANHYSETMDKHPLRLQPVNRARRVKWPVIVPEKHATYWHPILTTPLPF